MAREPLFRRDCTVYFLNSKQFRHSELILKIFRKGSVGSNFADNLHTEGQRFHRAATSHCAIPEPIFCIPSKNALGMECIDAPLLGTLLRRGIHSQQLRENLNHGAARWLGWFHGQSDIGVEPFDASTPLNNILKTLAKIHQLNPKALADDPFLDKCVKISRKIADAINGSPIPHASVHGDFTPYNLFTHGEKTVGIDFQAQRRLPVTHDICRFLLYLEVSQIIPTPSSQLRRHGVRSRDFEIFMEAYKGGSQLPHDELWLKLQFLEITRRLTSLSLPRASPWKQPLRAVEKFVLRRNAKQIIDALG